MSSEPAEPSDPIHAPASRLWWLLPAVGLVLLILFAMLFGGGPEKVDYGTSYDASDGGFRGVFLLMDELGYPVERSRRPTGGHVRWVLSPDKVTAKDAEKLDGWIQRGGIALLALGDSDLAEHLKLQVTVRGEFRLTRNPFQLKGKLHPAAAPDVTKLFAGETVVTGPPTNRTWGEIDGQPLITIYPHGRGEIWLLSRPDVFTNGNLREADNAVLACRLAEAMLRERPDGQLAFDEYCHGLRDRPSATELLFQPPVLGVTLEVLVLGMLVLWHYGVRFGALRTAPLAPRRSKEEFLDAMAELLTRNGDRAEAFRTVRDALRRQLEHMLGLPADTPVKVLVNELAERRGVDPEPLLQLLSADEPPDGSGASDFLSALHQLESAAHECLQP